MAISKSYSMTQVQATLDGQTIIGFWDGDDAIQFRMVEDIGMLLVGADGSSIFSQNASRAAEIILRLQHTSPTHERLVELVRDQRNGLQLGFPFDFTELGSGEGGNGDQFFVRENSEVSFGKDASVRQWTIITGDWTPKIPNNS